jgi:hypothetical protein
MAQYKQAPHWGNYPEGWFNADDRIGTNLGSIIRFSQYEGIDSVVTSNFKAYRISCVKKIK